MLSTAENVEKLLAYSNKLEQTILAYRLMLESRIRDFCERCEKGEQPVLRLETEAGAERAISLFELARIFLEIHLDQVEEVVVSEWNFDAMLKSRVGLFCQQHARGENPVLKIASKQGIETVIGLPELAKIFLDQHFDSPVAGKMTMLPPISETSHEHVVRDALRRLLKKVIALKIRLGEIPSEIRQWVGELEGYPALKYHEV